MKAPQYEVVKESPKALLLRDTGDHSVCLTITNGIERVVQEVADRLGDRRLFYQDSDGELTEVSVLYGSFAGFITDLKRSDVSDVLGG